MIFLREVAWKYPDAPAAFCCVFSQFHAFDHLIGLYAGSHSLIPCPGGTECERWREGVNSGGTECEGREGIGWGGERNGEG